MQTFKERQIKPYRCRNSLVSFKSSNGLKYHLDKVPSNEANRMEMGWGIPMKWRGVCQVLLRLEITKPRLPGKPPNRRELSTAAKLANLTEDRHRKSSYSASKLRRLPTRGSTTQVTTESYSTEKKRTKSLPPVFPITEVPSNSHLQSRKQTAFVQLGLLHPRSVFGLSTLLNFDDDFQLLQQASVSLVSRGAECVMISKKFFINQASELTKKWIRHNVRSYPSRETLQRNLQEKINWDAYKQDVIQTVIAR